MGRDYDITWQTEEIPAAAVLNLLRQTYWAHNRDIATIKAAMANSLCVGAVNGAGQLIGFARVITDFATMYYICDVVVDVAHRGRGVAKSMISEITAEPRLKNLTGMLLTDDAHGLYSKFGFLTESKKCMIRPRAAVGGERKFKWFTVEG